MNGRKINIPSYGVQVNDVITLKEKSRKNEMLLDNSNILNGIELPYLERNLAQFQGKLLRFPSRKEIPIEVNEILAVELYSK